jgi:hypothetical protein
VPATGSPFAPTWYAAICPVLNSATRALGVGNSADPSGTYAIPSSPPVRVGPAVTPPIANVPVPSGVRVAVNVWLVLNDRMTKFPAPGNPAGTNARLPTEFPTASVSTRSGEVLPGSIWPIVLVGNPVKNSTPPGPNASPPSTNGAVANGVAAPNPVIWPLPFRLTGTLKIAPAAVFALPPISRVFGFRNVSPPYEFGTPAIGPSSVAV